MRYEISSMREYTKVREEFLKDPRAHANAMCVYAGIEHRYDVGKIADIHGEHDDCEYFVLDPKHDPIAREAIRLYASKQRDTRDMVRLHMWMDRLDAEDA